MGAIDRRPGSRFTSNSAGRPILERAPINTRGMARIDSEGLKVGDKVQASIPGNPRSEEQPIGIVTAIAAGVVTFSAEGEYDMFYGPGDDDYYRDYAEPRTYTVPISAVRYHWPKET